MRYFLLILFFVSIYYSYAQIHIPRCNFDSLYMKSLQSNDFVKMIEQEEIAFKNFMSNKKLINKSNFLIPVVVHIVKNEDNYDMNITDAEIHQQIEILNKTYNLLNEDVIFTPTEFDTLIGNPEIEFCLASVDPNGYPTTGITRNITSVTSFSTVLDNIKYTDQGGVDAWDTDSYLNIWVGKITSGVLGYSNNPNANIPENEDGLVVGYQYFGYTDHEFYNMGKTAVHEIGHYLNLKHPWGIGGCDLNNDYVSDTPISESSYFGNPTHPQISCATTDMFMNYMDYVNDSSMVMFSQGQVDRMHFALNYYRQSLQNSNGCGIPSLISEYQIIHASDINSNDGQINLNIVSGIPPFSSVYFLEGDIIAESIYNLTSMSPGSYSVLITDSVGQELNIDFTISYYGNLIDADNFESYSVDSLLYTQFSQWTPFCHDSFSANIDVIFPFEGNQYLEINQLDGLNEISKNLGNFSSNSFDLNFQIYVPNGRSASYEILHENSCDSDQIAYKVIFDSFGNGKIYVGGQIIPFLFPQGEWFRISQLIDIDRNILEFRLGSQQIADWIFSWSINSEEGTTKLSEIVFNGQSDSLSQVHYFIDDFKMILVPNSDLITVENNSEIQAVIFPNPTSNELNIKFESSSYENYQIQIFNSLGQTFKKIDTGVEVDKMHSYDISGFPLGIYFVDIKSNKSRQIIRFVRL